MSAADHSLASVLSSMAQTLESGEDRRGRVLRVLRLLQKLVPYERCALLSTGTPPEFFVLPEDMDPEHAHALRSRMSGLLALVSEQETADVDALPALSEPDAHLSMPLIGLDSVVGLLFVEHPRRDIYDTQALEILAVVGSQLGNYLTLAQLLAAQAHTNQELQRDNSFQQLLVGIVGHDLRTPLSAITMAASLLQRRTEDTRSVTTLGRIIASAHRAARITHNLLDLTRARLGTGIPIVRKPTPLRPLLEEAVAEIQLTHPGCPLELSTPEPPLSAEVDADRLAQVVGNLLSNAATYSPPETPVHVRLETRGEEDFLLEVHNSGPPIPAALLGTLFEPFKRGDVADRKGLGLGLYIVDTVVRAHGGRITADSSAEAGTTFRVVMPLRAPPEVPG